MAFTANDWMNHLGLSPHPEGGYFCQSYKSDLSIPRNGLPASFQGDRSASTAIYFLLKGNDFSAFHRLASDEMWHFYAGSSLTVFVIDPEGNEFELSVGNRPEAGEVFQAVVKAGCWFASRVEDGNGFALVGCTVAPGFEFADFELATKAELCRLYPAHAQLIAQLTRH
jgi:uncharacterized protein